MAQYGALRQNHRQVDHMFFCNQNRILHKHNCRVVFLKWLNNGFVLFVNIVENAPFNIGKKKLYEGVPGNLFAYVCKLSWDNGNQGLVSFVSKTKLINHYELTLGAVHLGNHQMVIYPHEALKLIKKYYPQLVK